MIVRIDEQAYTAIRDGKIWTIYWVPEHAMSSHDYEENARVVGSSVTFLTPICKMGTNIENVRAIFRLIELISVLNKRDFRE